MSVLSQPFYSETILALFRDEVGKVGYSMNNFTTMGWITLIKKPLSILV